MGIHEVSAVLMTHHHRDQGQGLPCAVKADIPIWVPHTEQDLFHSVDDHWQAREVLNNYNSRQDRFSLLSSVPVAATLRDYANYHFGDYTFTVLPTPGHTTGSISLLAEIDGRRVAFIGDLLAGPGQLWSLAATQWSYNGGEGLSATILSLLSLRDWQPELLLSSHGDPIADPIPAIDLTIERLSELMRYREQNPRLFLFRERPYEPVTPHLLRNRTSMANSYVLLSAGGRALIIDFGYDFIPGIAAGSDRASRRPWLYTLPMLKEQFAVEQVEVVVPTHYHDDHVAGLNLLREVEGTQVWAAENFSDILEHPFDYNLPCLWYDPIPVDRVLPLQRPIQWHEYELTLYPLHGHTRYAVAISIEVDGLRVLATGDQYEGESGLRWNYIYQNEFEIDNYSDSAALYQQLNPDVILSGHHEPLWVRPGYFYELEERGEALARLHRDLLHPDVLGFDAGGAVVRIRPYQTMIPAGEPHTVVVLVRNPGLKAAVARVRLVIPTNWQVDNALQEVVMDGEFRETAVAFTVTPPAGLKTRRARLAADITINGRPWGQQAESLVTIINEQ
jgi:glyoxylase-like metal-dependent hydrolase (beta-lactamase superfamily II)